ncbi:MAG: copper-translocating P-type ATPase [Porphyromonadaceae bacterium CG2_30_38_12]|nr:MAG: copper-translocating P-type ATPase [Porphyromonadaceae bacterium CG2_30_38_12]
MKTEKFDIKGMTCSACVAHVEKSVTKLNGVESVQVNLLSNNMIVSYKPENVNSSLISKAVQQAGYTAISQPTIKLISPTAKNATAYIEMQTLKYRFLFSVCFLMPLVYISMGHLLELPIPPFLHKAHWFSLSQFMFTIPIVYFNRSYFTNGFRSLLKASPTMDSLIAIGASAAILYSLIIIATVVLLPSSNSQFNIHDIYFESAATILTLVTLGKFLEGRSKMRTTTALSKLIELAPKTATVERNGVALSIPIDEVVENDLVHVKSGQQIPVDGILLQGNGEIDESSITGESMPVFKKEGQAVISGTTNKSGYFVFRATRVGNNTTLAQIIQLVENAASSKAPISKLADKVSSIFVPVVIGISILATATWLLVGYSIGFSLSIGIAVLVISCPCALGLATPVAIMVGAGKGAELGLLIKNAQALEMAHKINTLVLDKTGTVTQGKPRITDMYISEKIAENDFINSVYSLEKLSEHILAAAITSDLETLKTNSYTISNFKNNPGKGISATIENNNYLIGNEIFMSENGTHYESHLTKIHALSEQGKTPVFVSKNNEIIGILGINDIVKHDSKQAIAALKALNIEVVMLTGDTQKTAQHIANQLELSTFKAGVLPNEKEIEISSLQKQGKIVGMVGDGINDAPALTKADVGIAMGAGTEIAIDSADIVLMQSSLTSLVTLLELSKNVMRNIRQNLFWAFIYNIVGIPLAAGIFYHSFGLKLNPMFAAAAMSLSSVTVVLNSLRLLRFKQNIVPTEQQVTNSTKNINIMKLTNGFKLAFNKTNKNNVSKLITIGGMTCGHCSSRVEKALNNLQGVEASVDLASNTATVKHSQHVTDEILKNAIVNAGYDVIGIDAQ